MSKKDKLLKRFLANPIKKDLTFDELETLLVACGFIKLDLKGTVPFIPIKIFKLA